QFSATGTAHVQYQRWRERPVAREVHATYKMLERGEVFAIIGEKLWMLELNRGHYRQPGMVVPQIIVKFIGLVHKVAALPDAIVCPQARHHCPDLAGRVQPGIQQG